jgi:hypothetical protein
LASFERSIAVKAHLGDSISSRATKALFDLPESSIAAKALSF